MKPIILAALVVLFSSSVFARSTKVRVEIHSQPEGARVTQDGTIMGVTPMLLTYEFETFKTCQQTKPLEMLWVSGATASSTISVCPEIGKNQSVTFARPADVAGLDADVQYAYQQAMLAKMAAQTNAMQRAASAAADQAMWASIHPIQIQRPVT